MDPITIQTDELIKWGTFGLKAATPLMAWFVTWRVGKWFFGKFQNIRINRVLAACAKQSKDDIDNIEKDIEDAAKVRFKVEKVFGNSPWAELYDHIRYAHDISLKEALIFEFCKKHRKSDIRPLSVCGADMFLDLLKEKTMGYSFQKVSVELAKFIIPKARRERKQRSKSEKSKKYELSGEALRSYWNSGGLTDASNPIKRRSKQFKKSREESMKSPVACDKHDFIKKNMGGFNIPSPPPSRASQEIV